MMISLSLSSYTNYRDIIMDCIEDKDESIRIRALELIMGMANKKNINDIVRNLLGHIDTAESTCKYIYLDYTKCSFCCSFP